MIFIQTKAAWFTIFCLQITGFAQHLGINPTLFKLDEPTYVVPGTAVVTAATTTSANNDTIVVQRVHTTRRAYTAAELSCMALLEQEILAYRAKAGEFAGRGDLNPSSMKVMRQLRTHITDLEAKLGLLKEKCMTGEPGMKEYLDGVVAEYKEFRRRKFESVIDSEAEKQMDSYMIKALEEITGFSEHLELNLESFQLEHPKYVDDEPKDSSVQYQPVPEAPVVLTPVHSARQVITAANLECMAILEQEILAYRTKAGEFAGKGDLSPESMKMMRSIREHVNALQSKLAGQQKLCQSGEPGIRKYFQIVIAEYKAFRKRKYECVEDSEAEQQMHAYTAKLLEEVWHTRWPKGAVF